MENQSETERNIKAKANAGKGCRKFANRAIAAVTSLIALFALWLIICSATGKVPMFLGYGIVRIQSGSMEPVIHVGDFILIEKIDPVKISEGDIVTFKSDDPTIKDLPNTHRVIDVLNGSDGSTEFVTKGDANAVPDSQTAKGNRIYGKYVRKLPVLTTLYAVLAKPYFFWPIIAMIFGFIVFFSIRDMLKTETDRKNKDIDRRIADEIEKLKQNRTSVGPDNADEVAKNGGNENEMNTNDTKGGIMNHVQEDENQKKN